jgi:hypothetical protein
MKDNERKKRDKELIKEISLLPIPRKVEAVKEENQIDNVKR